MNKKIIAKYNMFTNVDEVFNQNSAIVDAVAALKAQVTLFHNEYLSLDALIQPLQLDATGNAKAKLEAKLRLSKVGASVCGAMRSLANDTNDLVLFAKANYSPSDLFKLRDLVLQETGQALYELAIGMAASLLPYGVKAAELNDFDKAVNDFTRLNPKVRQVKVENKTTRGQLVEKVEGIDAMLRNKLDNSMMVMEFAQPSFFDLYRNARRNYSLGVRHEKSGEGSRSQLPEIESFSQIKTASDVPVNFKDIPVMNGNGAAV